MAEREKLVSNILHVLMRLIQRFSAADAAKEHIHHPFMAAIWSTIAALTASL